MTKKWTSKHGHKDIYAEVYALKLVSCSATGSRVPGS